MTQQSKSTYTIEELQAMPDADLNALAAELRGWTLQNVTDPTGNSFLNWVDSDDVGQYSPDEWTPAADRNESGELLRWAWRTHGILFYIGFTGGASRGYVQFETPVIRRTVHGNTARAETEVFCAAMLAMEKRLQ